MQIRKLKDEVAAFKDLRAAQDAAAASGNAREKQLREVLANRDLNILNLQQQLQSCQRVRLHANMSDHSYMCCGS